MKQIIKNPIYALLFRIFGLCVAITAITLQLFTNAIIGKGFMAKWPVPAAVWPVPVPSSP